ncbi:MAG TPA: twin-arginine translocase TatA/TatE family subunit [Candidatus Dormibacteraeota bacterium]|nr:twin-arginine translocase TatA/TatE family subunit [Candidatus Dormibacteraeota bacterium]
MFGAHWIWLVAALVIVLIIFGPGRLPELGGALGRAMREFRKATTELSAEVNKTVESTSTPQPAAKVDSTSSSDPKAPSSSN